MKPSAAAVLDLLRDRGERGVSPAEAREIIHCDRLAARVLELRLEGLDVTTSHEAHEGGSHARYVLRETPRQLELEGWTEAEARIAWGNR